jgi:hypothetical protein
MTTLTQSQAKELFDYRDGDIYWRVRTSNNTKMGQPAGYKKKTGYLAISVNDRQCLAHRLVWIWHYGDVPDEIDHINGVRNDNRIENLRPATPLENQWNSAKPVTNTTGFKGVCWNKKVGKYMAQIRINGRQTYLGLFSDPAAAHEAYIAAANKNFGEFARAS